MNRRLKAITFHSTEQAGSRANLHLLIDGAPAAAPVHVLREDMQPIVRLLLGVASQMEADGANVPAFDPAANSFPAPLEPTQAVAGLTGGRMTLLFKVGVIELAFVLTPTECEQLSVVLGAASQGGLQPPPAAVQ